MASLHLDPKSNVYHIRFRLGDRPFKRSLRTKSRKLAVTTKARVEETIHLVTTGRLEVPDTVDPATFLIAGGKRQADIRRPCPTLRDLFADYQKRRIAGAKEQNTMVTEDRHLRHLLRLLRPMTVAQSLNIAEVQRYVEARLGEKGRPDKVCAETIKKELGTFRVVWNWAVKQRLLRGPAPISGLAYPKQDEKPPFMTRPEIEAIISRNGITEKDAMRLWECMFLTRDDIHDLLAFVKSAAQYPFVYPFITFAAHTGARLSEICRSQYNDIDLEKRQVLIREKKKSRTRATTFRRVDISPVLHEAMTEWYRVHPGGPFTFCKPENLRYPRDVQNFIPIKDYTAEGHLKKVLSESRWKNVRGYHVFRHSFASNLAAQGVDQRIIDEWMGHQTEEMRRRYRHLLPEVKRQAILKLLPDV